MKIDYGWLMKYKEILKNKHILELGAGGGKDSKYLQSISSKAIVTDKDLSCNNSTNKIIIDHSKGLPFQTAMFDVVVASLCLHYFSWGVTTGIVHELTRVLTHGGTLISRLNSDHDVHYGAGKGSVIEPGLYRVGDETKRFFARNDIDALFSGQLSIISCEHKVIDRYMYPKSVFEVVAIS